MQNLMKKGDILSFSLETRGHTGIISQNEKQWTYINSGRLDHSISQNAPRHSVGEETLLSKINNWIKLAHKRNEALQSLSAVWILKNLPGLTTHNRLSFFSHSLMLFP